MICVLKISWMGDWSLLVQDSIMLDWEDWYCCWVVLMVVGGLFFLFDEFSVVYFCYGDGFVLDDGWIVEVLVELEELVEIVVDNVMYLVKIVWYLGNCYLLIQLMGDILCICWDYVIEDMVGKLGGCLMLVIVLFDLEGGVYGYGQIYGYDYFYYFYGYFYG